MTTSDYEYDSLDNATNEIRLVTIKAGKAADNSQCVLSKHSLEVVPLYEALSYAWGDPTETKPILLDGLSTQVTNNLYSALRHLRYENKDRTMWIDAVCINQTNDLEKNNQVRMMKRIYAKAGQVVVWLGDGIEHVGLVFEKLVDLSKLSMEEVNSLTILKLKDDIFGALAWKAFLNLFKSKWWSRIWVVQEVTVARNVVIVCGEYQITEQTFSDAVAYVGYLQAVYSHQDSDCANVREVRDNREVGGEILRLAFAYSSRESSNPRDKLFALLGIAAGIDFEPAYDCSVQEVYRKFVKVCVESSGTLDVLIPANSSSVLDISSWIPDWSKEIVQPFSQLLLGETISVFRAAGDTIAQVEFPSAPEIEEKEYSTGHPICCSIAGFVFDTVAHVGDVNPGYSYTKSPWAAFIKPWFAMHFDHTSLSGPYATLDDIRNAFSITLVGDHLAHLRVSKDPVVLSALNKWLVGEDVGLSPCFDITPYIQNSILRASYERRYFVSAKGYVGLGYQDSAPNDLICILFGGQTPFILRKAEVPQNFKERSSGLSSPKEIQKTLGGEGSFYKLVGECYVHGIMDGEAYDEFKEMGSSLKAQTFVLI